MNIYCAYVWLKAMRYKGEIYTDVEDNTFILEVFNNFKMYCNYHICLYHALYLYLIVLHSHKNPL